MTVSHPPTSVLAPTSLLAPKSLLARYHQTTWILVALGVFQVLHWFKPSEAYLVDFVTDAGGPYALSVDTVLNTVFPVATYSLFGSTFLMMAVFAAAGHIAGVTASGVAGAACVAVLLFGDSEAWLMASEALWAISFAALLAVPATLYVLLPSSLYQTASAVNTSAMLVGSVSSALVGYAITTVGADVGEEGALPSADRTYRLHTTVVVSLVSAIIAPIIAVAAGWAGILTRHTPSRDVPSPHHTPPHHTTHDGVHPQHQHQHQHPSHTLPAHDPEVGTVAGQTTTTPLLLALYVPTPSTSTVVVSSLHAKATAAPTAAQQPSQRFVTWTRHVARAAKVVYACRHVALWTVTSLLIRAPHTLVLTNWGEVSKLVAPQQQHDNGLLLAAVYAVAALTAAGLGIKRVAKWVASPLVAAVFVFLATIGCAIMAMAMAWCSSLASLLATFTVYNACAECGLAVASAQLALSVPLGTDHTLFPLQFPIVIGGKYLGAIAWQLIVQAVAAASDLGVRRVFHLYAAVLAMAAVPAVALVAASATPCRAPHRTCQATRSPDK